MLGSHIKSSCYFLRTHKLKMGFMDVPLTPPHLIINTLSPEEFIFGLMIHVPSTEHPY